MLKGLIFNMKFMLIFGLLLSRVSAFGNLNHSSDFNCSGIPENFKMIHFFDMKNWHLMSRVEFNSVSIQVISEVGSLESVGHKTISVQSEKEVIIKAKTLPPILTNPFHLRACLFKQICVSKFEFEPDGDTGFSKSKRDIDFFSQDVKVRDENGDFLEANEITNLKRSVKDDIHTQVAEDCAILTHEFNMENHYSKAVWNTHRSNRSGRGSGGIWSSRN